MLEQYFEESPLAMLISDRQLRIEIANQKAQSYLGRLDLVGRNINELIDPIDQAVFIHMLKDPESSSYREGRLLHSNGQSLFSSVRVSVSENSLCWYLEDHSRQKELELEIECYQTLPKEYGHDMNNLLTVILSASELALMDLDKDSPLREDMQDIQEAGYRAASQTRLFMNLGRNLVVNRHVIPLNALIRELKSLIQDLLGPHSSLELNLSLDNPNIYATKVSLQGAIAQMCAHARIIRPTSQFILSVNSQPITMPFSSHVLGVPPGQYAVITLRETNFPFTSDLLNTSRYLEPDEAEALTLAWEGVMRAKGSITQRMDKDDNICISIYLPQV